MSAGTLHRTPEEYAAAPWDEAGYTVANADGPAAVDGVACWPFAARETWDGQDVAAPYEWTLTHIPSGRTVAVLPSLERCQRAARDLVAATGGTAEWDFESATDLLTPEHRERLWKAWASVVPARLPKPADV